MPGTQWPQLFINKKIFIEHVGAWWEPLGLDRGTGQVGPGSEKVPNGVSLGYVTAGSFSVVHAHGRCRPTSKNVKPLACPCVPRNDHLQNFASCLLHFVWATLYPDLPGRGIARPRARLVTRPTNSRVS